MSRMGGAEAFGEQHLDRLAGELASRVPEHLLDLTIGPHDLAGAVDLQDAERRGLQDRLRVIQPSWPALPGPCSRLAG
jgi:hypothetical protein